MITVRRPLERAAALVLAVSVAAVSCTASDDEDEPATGTSVVATATSPAGPGRGFPAIDSWASYYGNAEDLDIDRTAAAFRIINVDADPDGPGFTPEQISRLRAGGRNRVISYLNIGAVERERSYWTSAPAGFVPAGENKAAQLGAYDGYPDELWMDPGDTNWRKLVVDHIAARLAARGVDGFYLDNLEVIEGGEDHPECSDRCRQGGLDLVGELRNRYPKMLIVLQNAVGSVSIDGRTSDGRAFPDLLDGIAREETFTHFSRAGDSDTDAVYEVGTDTEALIELTAWTRRGLRPGGRPFLVATEDYVNSCTNTADADRVRRLSRTHGFVPYVSNKSALQDVVCY